jgi:chromosome segregation ATPase
MARRRSALLLAAAAGVGAWCLATIVGTQAMARIDQVGRQAAPRVRVPAIDQQHCERFQKALEARESELLMVQGQRAGAEAEIRALEERLAEARQEKASIETQIARLQQWLAEQRQRWQQDCGKTRTCANYEEAADRLRGQITPLQDELDELGREIDAIRARISGLEKAIYPVIQEYGQLRCNNLVPGQASQETIDRCAALFSGWNALQAILNTLNRTLPGLQASYVETQQQVDALQKALDGYTTYLAANCPQGTRLQAARQTAARTTRLRSIGSAIEDALRRLKKLRAVQPGTGPR